MDYSGVHDLEMLAIGACRQLDVCTTLTYLVYVAILLSHGVCNKLYYDIRVNTPLSVYHSHVPNFFVLWAWDGHRVRLLCRIRKKVTSVLRVLDIYMGHVLLLPVQHYLLADNAPSSRIPLRSPTNTAL